MESYREIRNSYLKGESERSIAKKLGISRNTVSRYKDGANCPWEKKTRKRESKILTEETIQFIKECIEEDERENLAKQKHTAKRIYDRLVTEKGFTGGESTIRRKVREIRDTRPKAFIPLEFDPAEALQVDWGEAKIYLKEERVKINLFCIRMCYSCKPLVFAYTRQNEESFCDAFVRAFELLGGVPKRVIFDNAKVAVKEGFGAYAKKQAQYAALSSHYGFEAVFCNPASGHEKGLVEGLVGWSRRNILVPIPHITSVAELNEELLNRCIAYERHHIQGKTGTVGTMFQEEKELLMPLPRYRFEAAKSVNARVSAYATVRFQTNDYSVPVKYVGHQVGVKGCPEEVKIYYQGELVSQHDRLYGKHEKSCRLEDYLPLLEERGRAVLNALPVRQNLSAEGFEELKVNIHNKEKVIEILHREAGLPFQRQEASKTTEEIMHYPQKIREVNLQDYDSLVGSYSGGEE